MTGFEAVLEEALEALRKGADVDDIVRTYPAHAEALRPHLEAAATFARASAAQPREEWAAAARERFLIATGQRIAEAFDDVEPSPSFFASARVKLLMAAHKMRGERATQGAKPMRRFPLAGAPFRALAGAGMALVAVLGFSTYTVASSQAAVPGDWHYGVKLQTERVRLALAFSDDAKRDVQLDIASERAEEVEELVARGKIIGPGVLDRLTDQTRPLVDAASEGELDNAELARLTAVAQKQRDALDSATLSVAPQAQSQLAEAKTLAQDAVTASRGAHDGPIEIPADQAVTTADPTDETPEPTDTPDVSATPGSATPTASATPARAVLDIDVEPGVTAAGVTWSRLVVDRLTTLIPSEADGWHITGINTASGPVSAPTLVKLSNADGTSLITISPRNGDTYWFILTNGVFDEIRLRETRDGQLFVADREVLKRLYGPLVEVPLFVVDNITIEPVPTVTPEPTNTPTPPPQ